MCKKQEALIVVDVQHGFCSKDDGKAVYKQQIDQIVSIIQMAIAKSRAIGQLVIFTKTIYDPNKLPDNIMYRNLLKCREVDFLLPNSKSAELYRVSPSHSDIVFEKNYYDPFYNNGFSEILHSHKITGLTVCGFYLDVCVDSLIRSAYQKGYETTLLCDATQAQCYSKQHVVTFMKFYYNTKIMKMEDYYSEGHK